MSKPQKMSLKDPQFSKLRAAIWPIQNAELKKFLPMSLIDLLRKLKF